MFLGRNFNQVSVDRIDTYDEVKLGLVSTCCCTAFLWIVLVPLFEITGMNWIKTWEGKHAILYPKAHPGECSDALKFKYITPAQAFSVMDVDVSGDVDEWEWRPFAKKLNEFLTSKGQKNFRPMPCWQEYDTNLDGLHFTAEEFYNRVGSRYHWDDSMNAVKLRAELAKKFGSVSEACKLMDMNNNSQVNMSEFNKTTAKLPKAPSKDDTYRLFAHMDVDQDGSLAMQECHMAVNGFKTRLQNTYGNLTSGCEALDVNSDGSITNDEFLKGSKLLTPPIAESDAVALYPKLDDNGDGVVSVNPECSIDFATFQQRVQAAYPCFFFNVSDTNQDGYLSPGEFAMAGASLKPPADTTDMVDMWPLVDTNADASIEISELGCEAKVVGKLQFAAMVPTQTDGSNRTVDSWFEESLTKAVRSDTHDYAKVVEQIERRLADKNSTESAAADKNNTKNKSASDSTEKSSSASTASTSTEKKSSKPDTSKSSEAADSKPATTTTTTKKVTTTAAATPSPEEFCNQVKSPGSPVPPGMKEATIVLDYHMEIEAMNRVNSTEDNLKHLEHDLTSPEYQKFFQELATHKICLQGITVISEPSCVGAACPGAVTTPMPSTTSTTPTTQAPSTTTSPAPGANTSKANVTAMKANITKAANSTQKVTEKATTKASTTPQTTSATKPTTPKSTTTTTPPTTTTNTNQAALAKGVLAALSASTTTKLASISSSSTTPLAESSSSETSSSTTSKSTPSTTQEASSSFSSSSSAALTTATPVALTGAVNEIPITKPERGNYMGQAGTVSGVISLYGSPEAWAAEGLKWPNGIRLKEQITPIMEKAVESIMGSNIHVTGTAVGPLLNNGFPIHNGKEMNVTLQGNLADVGSVISEVQDNAAAVEKKIQDEFAIAHMTWGNYVRITFYGRFDYTITATGELLRQRAGNRQGSAVTSDGTPAVKVTNR